MFLKLLPVEEKTISLKASRILIGAVSSHLKETNISHSLLYFDSKINRLLRPVALG